MLSSAQRSPELVGERLKALALRYPHLCRLVELGESLEGRPLLALVIAEALQPADSRPAVLLNGAHHGGELLSVDIVLDAIDVLLGEAEPALGERMQRFVRELVIWCVPEVNPDGVYAVLHDSARSDRKNARDNNHNGRVDAGDGVDLNRNYPYRWGALGEKGSSSDPKSEYYRGPAPASEPETQAMMALSRRERPVASISYHTGTVAVLAPYTIDGCRNPEPNEAWQVAEWMVGKLPRHPQDRDFTLKRSLYPVDGTDQDWLRHELGTLALIIESARHTPAAAEERLAIVRVLRNTWMLLLERFLDGPSLSGEVKNEAGQAVVAELALLEQSVHEGERWTSRPRDGRFSRFLPGPGRYTVKAAVAGLPPVEQVIEVQSGRCELVLVISGAPASQDVSS
jgi:hypothetical protein